MDFLRKLFRLLFVFNIPPASEEELRTADSIIVMGLSLKQDGSAGPGNEIIAKVARELWLKYRLPIMAEWYGAQGDLSLPYAFVTDPVSTDEVSSRSYHTGLIVERLAKECKRGNLRKPIVIACPDHMGRVIWSLEKCGLEVRTVKMPESGYYVKGLIHPWSHRWRWLFRMRERVGRLAFWYWGYL